MKALSIVLFAFLLCTNKFFAQETDSLEINLAEIEKSFNYQTGTIELSSGNATLVVPAGFRYLDKKQAIFVMSDLWGNPLDSNLLGLLVPENRGVMDTNSWVFTINFSEIGYVEDDDAEDIDYDELLKEGQKEIKEANPERIRQGYEPIEFVGWAASPYYDKEKKTLFWAKEFKFGTDSLNTLNYNLRILGRRGIFELNAVASMRELPEVNKYLHTVLNSVEFKEGHRYADFDSNVDNVAAWTIGGLVAGKVLAKVGFFALIVKFWKIIALAVGGFFAAIWKRIKGRKNA